MSSGGPKVLYLRCQGASKLRSCFGPLMSVALLVLSGLQLMNAMAWPRWALRVVWLVIRGPAWPEPYKPGSLFPGRYY